VSFGEYLRGLTLAHTIRATEAAGDARHVIVCGAVMALVLVAYGYEITW